MDLLDLPSFHCLHMVYSPNTLKGNIKGILLGTTIGLIKGDTRSLDYSSYGLAKASHVEEPIGNLPGMTDLLAFLDLFCYVMLRV